MRLRKGFWIVIPALLLALFGPISSAKADSFTTTGANDYYFTLEEAQVFTVRTYAWQYQIDSMLWLYDSNNQLLAANDDSQYGLDSYITRDLGAGTYRLRTGVCCGDPNRWYGTSYVVDVNIAPSNAPSTTTTSTTTTSSTTTSTSTTTTIASTTTTTLAPLSMRTPTNLQAVAGNESVFLTWDAPEGGSGYAEVERYAVFFSSNNWQSSFAIASNNTSATIGNLTNGVAYQFRVRADNDSLHVYSSMIETYTASATPVTTTTSTTSTTTTTTTTTTTVPQSTSTTTTTSSSTTSTTELPTTTTQPVVVVVPVEPEPEPIIPEDTTPATEETLPEEIATVETLPEMLNEILPSEPETEITVTEPSEETTVTIPDFDQLDDSQPLDTEVLDAIIDNVTLDNNTSAEEASAILLDVVGADIPLEQLQEVMDAVFSESASQEQMVAVVDNLLSADLSTEELAAVFDAVFDGDISAEDTVALAESILEAPLSAEEFSTLINAIFDEKVSDEVLLGTFDAVLSTELDEEKFAEVVNVLENASISNDQVSAVVDLIIGQDGGIDGEQATELATSAKVLESIDASQATEVFDAIVVDNVSPEDGAAIAEALVDAPAEVKESFEEEINVFDGVFDTYVALGSSINVGDRRTLVAAGAAVAAVGAAGASAPSGGSTGPSGGSGAPSGGNSGGGGDVPDPDRKNAAKRQRRARARARVK